MGRAVATAVITSFLALAACSSGGDDIDRPDQIVTVLAEMEGRNARNRGATIWLDPTAPYTIAVWHQERFEVAVRNDLPHFLERRLTGDLLQIASHEVEVQAFLLYWPNGDEGEYRRREAGQMKASSSYGFRDRSITASEIAADMRSYRDQARAWVRRPEIVAEAGVVRERLASLRASLP